MDYYYHVLVVNGLKPLELQDFLQKTKVLAWLITRKQMPAHVSQEL